MTAPRHIAVIDVGKTNAKLALVDAATLNEIAVVTRPNGVLPGPPWPHFDLEGHWAFFIEALRDFHALHGIDAISVTTHGAAAVLLDAGGGLAAPMLDYEHDGPDTLAAEYDALRPDFALTGSPRLGGGLNLGAQLHWMLHKDPGLDARLAHVVTYPQYWGFKLTGVLASDVTSLGCHTDLWEPYSGQQSALVAALNLSGRVAPPRPASDVLGPVTQEIVTLTGLNPGTPAACGIHDSNASLYPHVLGRAAPFSVVSTGTWVIAMSVGGAPVTLDPSRDTLVNVSGTGMPVPSARFMGGREYELIRDGSDTSASDIDMQQVLDRRVMLLPGIEQGSGPFRGVVGGWTVAPENEGQKMVALGYYLALMTQTCLELTGARGPVIVEGPFARNRWYLQMLAALRPDGVEAMQSATGTSSGAALLFARQHMVQPGIPIVCNAPEGLKRYADQWIAQVKRAT
ncbi:FGGY-family carbohydrate kinase [Puniceibacterium sediminis]|uniref:Sugar (Pentulose or hexulose) kinase n=1 Tax=Puniceibacterium sediminis TaxID=1608407 RepID=A0A238XD74_9RHOB|nr:FGGY-family carbohydrate kinase [Puniceibacterium sediminis]SNR56612.1 Sugar (pentulose or hexulose) kinase [Puniceibacterium sediminis]